MADAGRYIDPAVRRYIADAISEAGGNEVFFVGTCSAGRTVGSAAVAARGDDSAVPAIAMEASVGDVVIHNHPNGDLTPSKADLSIAATLGSRGVGFFIVNNSVEEVYAVVEPFSRESLSPVEGVEVGEVFSEGGPLSRLMDGYEPREGQLGMSLEAAGAFNNNRVAALEAGTGVGKSFAYLVPAVIWAATNRERVVVSTNTINLQEQLVHKDLPLLSRAMPYDFKAVLVKGRSNYLCLRKLDVAMSEGGLLAEEKEQDELNALFAWSKKTREGSRSDLSFVPDNELWERVRSESDTCTRLKCRYFQHCFFFRARREAAAADILVVNHHILLADIALRHAEGGHPEAGILPGYRRLVIDEGHNLEDGATSYFGSRASRLGFLKLLGRLQHRRGERDGGLLPFFLHVLKGARGDMREKAQEWKKRTSARLLSEKQTASDMVEDAFDTLYGHVTGERLEDAGDVRLRLKDDTLASEGWAEVAAAFARLEEGAMALVRSVRKLVREAEAAAGDGYMAERLSGPLVEMKALADRIEGYLANIDALIKPGEDDGLVRWVEAPASRAGKVISICGSPLNVAQAIKERVYDTLSTVIITSATLTVKKDFRFLAGRTGLDLIEEGRLVTGIFPSPFDYKRQMVIGIPSDIPSPTSPEFASGLVGLIRRSVELSEGRAFVLFTSYGLLNRVHRELGPELVRLGFCVMRQGEEPRHRLINRFRRERRGVLLATDSFWEGVDVSGDALSNVIITKLPFSVPDDPVIEARQEEVAARGGNPFMEYVVPQAVIKFRQGFGRLIRTKTDRGSIMVFDRRVVEKSYGREFIGSLPEGTVIRGTREEVFGRVEEFFARGAVSTGGAA